MPISQAFNIYSWRNDLLSYTTSNLNMKPYRCGCLRFSFWKGVQTIMCDTAEIKITKQGHVFGREVLGACVSSAELSQRFVSQQVSLTSFISVEKCSRCSNSHSLLQLSFYFTSHVSCISVRSRSAQGYAFQLHSSCTLHQ